MVQVAISDPVNTKLDGKPVMTDEQKQLTSDVKKLMATPEGRRFVLWLLKTFPPYRECYTKNADTYYFLGQVSVSRCVVNLLSDAVPDLMVPLIFREETYSE